MTVHVCTSDGERIAKFEENDFPGRRAVSNLVAAVSDRRIYCRWRVNILEEGS
jgi:hypothetical protein